MPISDLMKPLRRQTLSTDVYQQLKDLLISGRVMPGEPISLRATAEAFGVSVMPVREAMQRLVAEQALEVGPSRTIRVPSMTVSQFREITRIRINLEGLATETAAQLITEEATRRIAKIDADFTKEMTRNQPDGSRLINLNKELHFAVYQAAEMPMLLQLIEALWLRIGPILNYDLRVGVGRLNNRAAIDSHSLLVDALGRRDGAAAKKAIKTDIESAAAFIVSAGVLVTPDA
ncbi:GntR family transcriptional regulator [Propionivibrio sp.]|uniref:GntR family transcriptional regulator n=1 Tax=Propionivibrio sp. TaxID=2212460 RepID=UPI0039E4BD54